jgi:hypothetical protein
MSNYEKLLNVLKDEVQYLESYIKEKRQEIKQNFDASSEESCENYRTRTAYFEGKESVLFTLQSIVKISEDLNK